MVAVVSVMSVDRPVYNYNSVRTTMARANSNINLCVGTAKSKKGDNGNNRQFEKFHKCLF